MFSREEATAIATREFPDGDIQRLIEYKDVYLFQIFSQRPDEEFMDPFYSVHTQTGEFREFSILTDGDTNEIIALFLEED